MTTNNSILGFERRIFIEGMGRWLWFLRTQPSHSAHYLAGIALPPHERLWLRMFFSGYKENNIVASRGTSKSFSHVSLAAPLKATLFKNKGFVALSASGFRGGKLLMEDSERLFKGRLRGQILDQPFLAKAIDSKSDRVVKREPDKWGMFMQSQSTVMTVPTNNFENLRGIRATDILIDERNTFPGEHAQKIIRPMMVVGGGNFRKTATAGDANTIYQISTIDYTIRDWYPEIEATRKVAKAEWEAQKALRARDFKEYNRMLNDDEGALLDASVHYSRVDYTDLLIPTTVTAKYLDGETYRIKYPVTSDVTIADVTRFDKREKREYIYTYPVDKKGLEEPLINGTMDRELWLAEQRNVFIAAAGTFFTHALIQKVAERPIYEAEEVPGLTEENPLFYEEFYAPVMYKCGDPCVLGVDYARDSDHFAIVVIRLGELADTPFDPSLQTLDSKERPCLGKTPWNHVVWAESWERWKADEAAERIREMLERYNVVYHTTAHGMGMDKGGGGSHVRDDLANPKPSVREDGTPDPNWVMPVRIYDDEDEDYMHYGAMQGAFWSGLELIKPTNESNTEQAFAVRGMMQQTKLYIGYAEAPSKWAARLGMILMDGTPDESHPDFYKWNVGYMGIRRLVRQLLKIQTKITETGKWKFEMPGDREKEEGKKDLFSALIYAGHVARQHLVAATRKNEEVPMVAPVAVEIGRARGGMDSWFTRLGL